MTTLTTLPNETCRRIVWLLRVFMSVPKGGCLRMTHLMSATLATTTLPLATSPTTQLFSASQKHVLNICSTAPRVRAQPSAQSVVRVVWSMEGVLLMLTASKCSRMTPTQPPTPLHVSSAWAWVSPQAEKTVFTPPVLTSWLTVQPVATPPTALLVSQGI